MCVHGLDLALEHLPADFRVRHLWFIPLLLFREGRRKIASCASDHVDLSKLPVACSGKHAEAVSEAIKMRRRNTIQRDAMHSQIKDEHIEHHVHA